MGHPYDLLDKLQNKSVSQLSPPHNSQLFDLPNLQTFFCKENKIVNFRVLEISVFLLVVWQSNFMMDVNIRKNIPKIVFHALSNGAIRIWLRCSGAEIYRFLLVHSRKNILYLGCDTGFFTGIDLPELLQNDDFCQL